MWLVILQILAICVVLLFFDTRKPDLFPPGPKWLPVLGNYWQFCILHKKLKLTHLVWNQFALEYGPLVGLRLGLDRILIVSGFKMAREILAKEEFEGRPDGFFFRLRALGQRLGVAFVDGQFGLEQRRFCLQNLREFGFGRSVMKQRISEEASELVSWLKIKSKEGPIQMNCLFDISILNTLWGMLAGQRYSPGDCRLNDLLYCINDAFRLLDMSGGLLNQMPFIRFLAPEKSSYNKMVFLLNKMTGFMRETVEEHKKTYKCGIVRDVVDAFLYEIEKNKYVKNTTYTEDQLVVLLLDLFMAGSETTSRTLAFAMLYLLKYEEVQKKAHSILDSVVGRGNQPHMQHRSRLSYIEAVVMEVQRLCNITATTAAHRAKIDTMVSGYKIPKDTMVLVSLYSVHMDTEHWTDPENFRPERFLDQQGKLMQDDWFMPFSYGKRRCIGESMARGSLFLFLSTVLHNFTITSVPDSPQLSLEQIDGATLSPAPFNAVLTPRF